MRGRAIKLSNIDSPCYDKKTHTDCQNSHIGCRQSCQAWEIYEAFKNEMMNRKIEAHNTETDIVLYDILSKLKAKRRNKHG